jgi:hypothetical protein
MRTGLRSSRNIEMKKTTTGKDRSDYNQVQRVGNQSPAKSDVGTKLLVTCESVTVIRDAARSSERFLVNLLNRLSYETEPA